MKTLQQLVTILAISLLFVSCSNDESLQQYMVRNMENPNFSGIDMSKELLMLDVESMNEREKQAYNSIKKVNGMYFRKSPNNEQELHTEKEKLTQILDSDRYTKLMTHKSDQMNYKLAYLGEKEAIDEFIIYGDVEELGFGVARVLCNDLKVSDLKVLMDMVSGPKVASSLQETVKDIFN